MGLFKKRKDAIEREKMEKTYEIVCLYCFRHFDHDKVLFRAVEAVDAEGYRAEADHILDEYRMRFNQGSLGELPVVLDPADFGERNKGYLKGILSTLRDDHKNISSKRLCPYCHNNISASAGFTPSTIISVAGAGRVGKSTFIASLIHTIKAITSYNFDVFCAPITNEMGRKFKFEYEDPLSDHGFLLDAVQKGGVQEPLVFTFSFADGAKPEIHIVFFDVACDGVESVHMDIYAAQIRNSSGVIFLVDPLQFRPISRKIQLLNHIKYEQVAPAEPATVLNNMVYDYIYKANGSITSIPTAVVVTKTDLLEVLTFEGEFVRPQSSFFTRYEHRGVLSKTAFDAINEETEEFIRLTDPNFRNALKRNFANLGFFGVSALGAHPDAIRQRMAQFAPVRVDEPLLWILFRLGYVEGYHEGGRL